MKKSDLSIKKITIAAIKRSTIPPFDFEYSKIYEETQQIENPKIKEIIKLDKEEELICSTLINESLGSILTTRRIISLEEEGKVEHKLKGLKQRSMGDFKGKAKQKFTKGFLHFDDDKIIPYFIETGRASMIMIYGVNTVAKLYINQAV